MAGRYFHIVALAARPLAGAAALSGSRDLGAFVRAPGGAPASSSAAFGPEPAGPFSSVFFDGEAHARDAARRDGLRVVGGPGDGAEPGLFWTPPTKTPTTPRRRAGRLRAAPRRGAGAAMGPAARAGGARRRPLHEHRRRRARRPARGPRRGWRTRFVWIPSRSRTMRTGKFFVLRATCGLRALPGFVSPFCGRGGLGVYLTRRKETWLGRWQPGGPSDPKHRQAEGQP